MAPLVGLTDDEHVRLRELLGKLIDAYTTAGYTDERSRVVDAAVMILDHLPD